MKHPAFIPRNAPFVLLFLLGFQPLHAGSLLREVWTGISGNAVGDLTNNPAYPASPTSTTILTDFFETPVNEQDNYGQRLRGTLTAPVTGDYTFWIASDDNGALYLSTDASPLNIRPIAHVPEWTSSREWGRSAQQQSAPVRLVAGARYYVEAFSKEGGGGDNLAVRWLRPDGRDEGPIPLDNFIAWGLNPEPPCISLQPVPATVEEGRSATFTVGYDNQGPTEVFWRRNGVPIPGAVGTMFTLDPARLADDGAFFQASLTNGLGTTNSTAVRLTVTADVTRPLLVSALASSPTNVQVQFSEPVNPPTGSASASFALSPALAVLSVAQDPLDARRLILSTARLAEGTNYALTVNNVSDRARTPSTVAANSRADFGAGGARPFLIEAEDFNFGGGQTIASASVMPYTGGAYAGRRATLGVDFVRDANGSSTQYRDDERIPINDNLVDSVRAGGAWVMTTNFKLGWIGAGQWFNYTRNIPFGRYRVLAALSHGDTTPGALQAGLEQVVGSASTASQTVQPLGTFVGDGTGGWGVNRLVPLRDAGGVLRTVSMGGNVTLRMNPVSGDFDYFILMPATPPVIASSPASLSVIEGRDAVFSVETVDDDATAYQWHSNSVPIPGATSQVLVLPGIGLSANGARIRVAVGNEIGSVQSAEAVLSVSADATPPVARRVFNVGSTNLVVEFDEPVLPPAGPASAAFGLDAGASVTAATQGNASHRISLTVAGLAFGTRYTLTLSGVRDRSAAGNLVAPGSRLTFVASELAPSNIGGGDAVATSVTRVGDGAFDVSATGGGIGGGSDSAGLAWREMSGNFDLRVRVESISASDPYMTAGIVARSGLEANSAFGGVFASTAGAGSFFESRSNTGGQAGVAAPRGGYPVNYPSTWLRLRRVGAAFTGFGSLDGLRWTALGSANIPSAPARLVVGLSIAGRDTNFVATARFRDHGPVVGASEVPFNRTREGLAVSSRRTRMVFSEIMYNPPDGWGTNRLEFVELYNAGDVFEDLGGWTLAGGIRYRFPAGFRLGAGQFVVVASDPAAVAARYGITGVLGPFDGALNNAGDTLQLRDEQDALKLELEYDSLAPWPVAADGGGHSLVLANPSYGEADPRAWAQSARVGGNPGEMDPIIAETGDGVVVNEILAHTDLPQVDLLELYNGNNTAVDLGGCVLTDDITTNRFRFPPGRTIPARGFLALDENQLGFRLNAGGETVYLVSSNGLRVLDAIRFGALENGVAYGRSPDGSSTFRRLSSITPSEPNARWRVEDVVINEIMYNPISQDDADEFVELHNRSAATVNLSGWRLREAVSYTFPTGTIVPPGGFVVVGSDRTRLLSNHPQLTAANTFGNWSGRLRNRGERLSLTKPDDVRSTNQLGMVATNVIHIVVSEVTYGDGGRWGKWADGGGSSLELVDPRADTLRASSWADSDETAKAQWQQVTITATMVHSIQTPDRLQIGMLGEGECLVDEVQVLGPAGTSLLANGGFETGTLPGANGWAFLGHHGRSQVEAAGAFAGSRVLRVVAPGDMDAGRNCIRAPLSAGLGDGSPATIRARVRWQAGWPEILFRVRGGGIELPARMVVPRNLGTPGLPNSRRVANAGPAIYAVNHSPAVPEAGRPVVVTARVSDPDGISSVSLRFREGDAGAFSSIAMRDDGAGGDAMAGDGLWSATLAGRPDGTLVQFRVEAFDGAGVAASASFPSGPVFAGSAPVSEALIRWGDPVPFGTFGHVHLWLAPTMNALLDNGQDAPLVGGLDNTYRDATLVHGNLRVIYNAGIRRKGSPFTGQADYAVTVPRDDLLLGAGDRVYGLTGNGGEEATRMRNQIANWFTREMRLPYLNTHYVRVFRNGGAHGSLDEDLEQPANSYAESWYPDGGEGDLRKIAFAFEFRDDGGFDLVGADIGAYRDAAGRLVPARYRFTWQPRPTGITATDFTNFFALVAAANDRSTNFVPGLLNIADIDQWMRTFALDGVLGNWDTWGTGNAQNKYAYYQPGGRWVLLPWDMDWVLGVGDGPGRRLFGGNDGNVNVMFDTPAFRRMAWRGYQLALDGPMLPENYRRQFEARSSALAFNQIGGVASPNPIASYIDARRQTILAGIRQENVSSFAITSNGGAGFDSPTSTAVLEGTAPFAAAGIEVNGRPVPVEWTTVTRFRIQVPLSGATNVLNFVGVRADGSPIPGMAASVTVRYRGVFERPEDFVVINEINYNGAGSGGSFLELFNRSTTTAFDLTGHRLSGVGYTFPEGSVMPPRAYWVLARDRAAFSQIYGAAVPVFDQFPGSLDNGGERVALVRVVGTNEVVVSDVRYDNRLPWPTNAAGLGPSLQLVDAALGSWRVGNWIAAATNAANRVTPGRANLGAQSLAPFPPLWINEVLPDNPSGPRDNAGDRDPFVEIVNTGATALDLSSLFLTADFTNLTAWRFPAGTVVPPRGFLTVWADGEPAESAPGIPHTSFRLNPTNGSVALVRLQGAANTPAVMDYLTWNQLPAGRSFGALPDGEPRSRRVLFNPTPGATNDPSFPGFHVVINEFMAQNNATIRDPADGDFDDWIEIYNAGPGTVDLAGFYLTDRLTNSLSAMYRIPGGYPIPSGGFLLVWADNETGQNSATNRDLHASFALARSGEQVGLFDPNGVMVDGFTFGPQTNDVSMGRFPDGAPPQFYAMEQPTPRQPNILAGGNRPPAFSPIPDITVVEQTPVAFTATASDPDAGQTLTYSLGPDAPPGAVVNPASGRFDWLPAESDGPGAYSFFIRATDSGQPPRVGAVRVNIAVMESNSPPVVVGLTNVAVGEGSLLAVQLPASDADIPANVILFEAVGAVPAGLSLTPAGLLSWVPGEAFGDTVQSVQYRVTDNGVPPLSSTGAVRIAVAEVNDPPVFAQPPPQFVDENTRLTLQLAASDPEGAGVRFSLDNAAPRGLTLNSDTGLIDWTPDEEQGPGDYSLLVRATEGSGGGLSVVRQISIQVREVNRPPALAPIADVTVDEGATVAFRATATDPDRPAQTLRFTLGGAIPAGAEIDTVTGDFLWTTHEDDGAATNTFTVRVADNGPGNLSDSRVFRVVTRPRFKVVFNEVLRRPVAPGTEFVELLNASARTPWDVSGLRLTGSNLSFTFPPGSVLAPGRLLVVVGNSNAFRAAFGGQPGVAGVWSGPLGAVADTLRLVRPGTGGTADAVLDRLDYAGGAPWSRDTNASPSSLQLVDARRDRNRAGNWSAAQGFQGNRAVIGFTDDWRFFQDGAPAGGTNWRTAPFNDSAWQLGGGLLYVEDAALPTNRTTPLALGQVTYYFRRKVVVPALTPGAVVNVRTVLDDGYVLWVNGRRAHSLGMADVEPTHAALATRVVPDAVIEGPFAIAPQLFVPGENTFAVEVHQGSAGSSDIVFGLEVTVEGGTLDPATPGAANNVAASLPAFPTLRINEVLARNTAGLRDASGTPEPWVELFNSGRETVPLDGLFLSDTDTNLTRWAFPAGRSIPPGGFLTVFLDGQIGQTTETELHASFRPSGNPGEPLRLTLSRLVSTVPNVVDYLHAFVPAAADISVGHLPDGEIAVTSDLSPTPGYSNGGPRPNRPPVFTPTPDRVADEGAPLRLNLAAADPDDGQTLTFSLVSGPDGLGVSPEGLVAWTPAEPQGPSANRVTVRVVDSGSPALSATNAFTIVVREVNAPPVFVPLHAVVVDEGVLLSLPFAASDPDLPAQGLIFSLVSGPAGLTVTPSGVLAWMPSEDQGPSTNTVLARVADDGVPPLSATNALTIVVREVNRAPSLGWSGPGRITAGVPFASDLIGSDPDRPANGLTYQLLSGPDGLMLSPAGRLAWTPTEAQAGTNGFLARVTDDGNPPLSATNAFTLVVVRSDRPLRLDPPAIGPGGRFSFVLHGAPGRRYRIDRADVPGNWTPFLEVEATEAGVAVSDLPEAGPAARFYRAVSIVP